MLQIKIVLSHNPFQNDVLVPSCVIGPTPPLFYDGALLHLCLQRPVFNTDLVLLNILIVGVTCLQCHHH